MPSRLIGIDLLRGISAFGIVACHLMLFPATAAGATAQRVCDFFVAVFAALAGFCMTDRIWSQPLGEYAKSRARRLLPAYLLWSVIFVAMSAAFKLVGHESVAYLLQGRFWLDVILKGGASCHLWFLVCLFYAQLLLRGAGARGRAPLPVLAVVAVGFVGVSTMSEDWWFKYFSRLIGFLLAGVSLRGLREGAARVGVRGLAALMVIALGAHFALGGVLPQYIRDLIAVGPVVLFFATVQIENVSVAKAADFLAATSLTVFLVHPIFTKVGGLAMKRFFAAPYGLTPVLIDWSACYLGALIFSWVTKRVGEKFRV